MKHTTPFRRLAPLALAAVMLVGSAGALGAPAASSLHTVSQPDGATFQARQWGDEFLSGWENADGYTIVLDAASKTWCYAVKDQQGRLVSSAQPVGRAVPPAPRHLRPAPAQAAQARHARHPRQGFAAAGKVLPVTPRGTASALTVLVNFSDTQPSHAKGDFDSAYFSGSNSLATFYSEQSRGAFTVSAGPQGVVNWVNVPRGHDYYGADDPNDPKIKDVNKGELPVHVVAALNAQGFDFAPYDGNGDCYVDALAIIYQGPGQHESGNTNDIWPSQVMASPIETNSACPSGGKIYVSNLAMQPERGVNGALASFSTYAHEFGHALGLPDLYDTTYASQGAGNWSLMASGDSRDGDGKPIGFDAWSKLYLGWVTPVLVNGRLADVTVEPVLSSGKVYQLLPGSVYSGEYFLVENRARMGYDTPLASGGLLVWHIDGDLAKARYDDNTVNDSACVPSSGACAQKHLAVGLVQADNLWQLEKSENDGDAGDPFPGSANVTAIDDQTAPNLRLWSGAAKGLSISNIRVSGNNVIATFDSGNAGPAGDDSERLFRWAEFKYPTFFPSGGATQSAQGYVFRHYPATGNYLATKDGRVIVHNGRDWQFLDVGALADFLATAGKEGY